MARRPEDDCTCFHQREGRHGHMDGSGRCRVPGCLCPAFQGDRPVAARLVSGNLVVNLDRAGEKRTAETADGNSDRDRMGLASPAPATDPPTQKLIDLPDHLRAYHGWLEEDVLFFEGKWRPTHELEHAAGIADHPREDWSA